VLVGVAGDRWLAPLDAVPVAMLTDVDLLQPSEENAVEWGSSSGRSARRRV
jgi:hypothetical protein